MEKDACRDRLGELVAAYDTHAAEYARDSYNETQARTDFITPLLQALGWDVYNEKHLSPSLREVLEEANVSIADDSPTRKPDYELRLARIRKLFVEAKKPAVNVLVDRAAAFQARRYGFSAGMPIVVLTNFRQLVIHDATVAPNETDEAHVARIATFGYDEYLSRFDELWDCFSREAVYSGLFDDRYASAVIYRGVAPFDRLFLQQVRSWRNRLAIDIHRNVPTLRTVELTFVVQRFLSRLVFLRICEDREIEEYEQLLDVVGSGGFAPFKSLVESADNFYNSGLFDLTDDRVLGPIISDDVLKDIVAELYYPRSPYTFAVVETEVLGRIYEQFLGEVITVDGGEVEVTLRPEVRESGGVVPTPREVVDDILDRTVHPLIVGRSPDDLETFTVLDMACGSGIFLLSAFERLCDHYLSWYLADGVGRHRGVRVMEDSAGWRLTFAERRKVLVRHIRGVDIDAEAVEVAQLSLQLKLVEGEARADLEAFVAETGEPALPDLTPIIRSGNSLVSRAEWEYAMGAGTLGPALSATIRPFEWQDEFPDELGRGGFDVIVGNPPYIRIQHMARYSSQEVSYYQSTLSPYSTAASDNFDKYALFIERALSLLVPDGRLGFITPHKFMTIQSGERVRELLGGRISELVHFGAEKVFPGVENYTAITICGAPSNSPVPVETVRDVEAWLRGDHGSVREYPRTDFGADSWRFASAEFKALIARLIAGGARQLGEVADIFVGVQTSADRVYIVRPVAVDGDFATIEWGGRTWQLERGALRPCLNDAVIERYVQPEPNRWIICPYYLDANGTAHLLQPGPFQTRFPDTFAYLEARQDELARRNVNGGISAERQWYQYGRSQSLEQFGRDKIILPVLSLEPRYAPDTTDIVVTGGGNGPYYMLRGDDPETHPLEVLLAVLNHPLAEATVRTNTSVFQGGYYSHGKQFIKAILVPSLTDAGRAALVAAVQDRIAALAAVSTATTPGQRAELARQSVSAERRVVQLVNEAFGLTDEDWAVIRSVPMP
jgi:hypothetical protein